MTNRAAWAFVAGEVRSYSVDGFPVVLGLHRLLRWAERECVTKSGKREREPVISAGKAVTKLQSAGGSKKPSAAGSTPGKVEPRLSPAQRDALRARARARKPYVRESQRRG
jgi:hypothetical protein